LIPLFLSYTIYNLASGPESSGSLEWQSHSIPGQTSEEMD
jgi:hypothetical protein